MPSRPYLPAMVPPAAAYAISLAFGPQIEALARERKAAAGLEWLGREMELGLAQMRESGRQWLESTRAEQAGEVGNSGEEPQGRELSTEEAAKVLEVSPERVRALARTEAVRARRRGRRAWVFDEVDVLAYRDRRGRRAS